MSLHRLRTEYRRGVLLESHATEDPLALFARWFKRSLRDGGPDRNAMVLSTADGRGRPDARVVLLKEFGPRGFVFATNYDSRKGRELAEHPFAALQFHWVELERVVRIEGRVERVDAAQSDAYFASRPLDSRLGAWASPQSQVIASRAVLVANAAKAAAQHGLNPSRPPHWGGFRLLPERWEFWQGRKSRLHDRLVYRLDGGQWVRERLAP